MGLEALFKAAITGAAAGQNPLRKAAIGKISEKVTGKKAKPKTTTTTKAGKQGEPGTLEAVLDALANRPSSDQFKGIPQAPPIAAAPPPPRGDPNAQKLLEEVILSLGGLK